MKAIDLFAGGGGFTLGAMRAGVDVVWAANHWPLAVETHAMNHPLTRHECQDLRQADFTRLPSYDLLLAAPACQGHSPASQPRRRAFHDASRATAWAVIDCADVTEPRAIIVENVPRFREWRLFDQWIAALQALGYHVATHLAAANRLGVPQRRTRLIITAMRRPFALELPTLDEVPIGAEIDWSAPGWKPIRSARPDVQARIARGRSRCGDRFLSQHVTNHPGVPLDEPIRTVTTKDHWILVAGDAWRQLTLREYARAQAFPDTFRWPETASRRDVVKLFGNAIPPPVAEHVVRQVCEAA